MDASGVPKHHELPARQAKRWAASLAGHGVSFAVVRFLLGGILLTAAALKAELLFMSSAWPVMTWSFWLVLFELAFAAWLFSGRLSAYAWWAAAGCFGTFAIVAGFKVLRGDADCGCFGVVETPPWVTFSLDVTALLALLATYHDRAATRTNRLAFVSRFSAAIGYALVLLVVAKLSLAHIYGNGLDGGDASITDPSEWIGHRFPLLEQIEIGSDLSAGEYIVVLHRHDCPLCEETLNSPWLCEAAWGRCDTGQIALVELPPCGPPEEDTASRFPLSGRLNVSEPCLLPAPTVVLLEEGRVVSVATGQDSKARLRELLGPLSKRIAVLPSKPAMDPREMLAFWEPRE
jgi:Methylamine utilisation protein MauE